MDSTTLPDLDDVSESTVALGKESLMSQIITPEQSDSIITPRPFTHLHCHSHYSLLDGAGDIGKLVQRCVDHGMNSLALTDHGNLHGARVLSQSLVPASIPSLARRHTRPGSRFEKEGFEQQAASYHLTLLAKNRTGFKSRQTSEHVVRRILLQTRIDKEIFEKYSEGIICLSGCVSSESAAL